MSDDIKKRLHDVILKEANRLQVISLRVGLGDQDFKRLDLLARAVRMLDGGELPDDSAARSASMSDLIASLGEPVA